MKSPGLWSLYGWKAAVFWPLAGLLVTAFPLEAAELLGPPQIEIVSPTSVILHWQTDVPTASKVAWGENASPLDGHFQASEITASHVAPLTGLKPAAHYFFLIGTARRELIRGEFTTASSSPISAPAVLSTTPGVGGNAAGSVLSKTSSNQPPSAKNRSSFWSRLTGLPTSAQSLSSPQSAAPPTNQTWGNPASLPDHFARHGGDFQAHDAEEYARLAWDFRRRAAAAHYLEKQDATGTLRIYDSQSGAFGAYNRDGSTKTFFKPNSAGYFQRQPGRLIPAS